MITEINKSLSITKAKEQYDEAAKRLLSNKYVIGNILIRVVDEFKGMTLSEVIGRIEGDVMVGTVPVDPGATNSDGEMITGFNTEDSEINEGMIRFDIIFYVRMRDGISKMIVNIEAQKDEPFDYFLLDRGIYYTCRMVSSQKGREFTGQRYDCIRKVESIWICMNQKVNSLTHYRLQKENILGDVDWNGNEDMLGITLIGLSDEIPDEKEYELHRMLGILFSSTMNPVNKCEILENEFDIPMTTFEEVNAMCNLSEAIEERALRKGEKKGRAEGEKKGRAEGKIEGKIELLCDLVNEGTLSEEAAALKASMSLSEFKDVLNQYALS